MIIMSINLAIVFIRNLTYFTRLSNRRGWVGRGSWVVGRGSWV